MKKLIILILLILNINNIYAENYMFKIEDKSIYKVILNNDNNVNKEVGINGTCGLSQNKYTEEEPSNNLCETNYGNTNVSLNGYNYFWSCLGSPENESHLKGNDVSCMSYKNLPLSDYGINFYRVVGSLESPSGNEFVRIPQLLEGNYTIPSGGFVSLNISANNIITLNQISGSFYGNINYNGYVISGLPIDTTFTVVENTTSVDVSSLGNKIFFNYAGRSVSSGGKIRIKINLNEGQPSCGTINETYTSTILSNSSNELCEMGQVSQFNNNTNSFNWQCYFPSINKNVSCVAYKNPVCGSDNSQALDNTPTNLCTNGTSSSVINNNGVYNWSCSLNNKIENCEAYSNLNLINDTITAYRVAHNSLSTPYLTRTITNNSHILNQEYIVPNETDYFSYKIVNNNTIHLIQKKSGTYGSTVTYNGYVLKIPKINSFEIIQNTSSIPIIQYDNDLYINYKGRSVSSGTTIIIKIK